MLSMADETAKSHVLHTSGGCLHSLRWAHPSGHRWRMQAALDPSDWAGRVALVQCFGGV